MDMNIKKQLEDVLQSNEEGRLLEWSESNKEMEDGGNVSTVQFVYEKKKDKDSYTKLDLSIDSEATIKSFTEEPEEQNKELLNKIKGLTRGVTLPLTNGKSYIVVFTEKGRCLIFNVVGNTIYLNGTGWDDELRYADNTSNPITLDTVKLISNLL